MSLEGDIHAYLEELAPVVLKIARDAQDRSNDFPTSRWALENLTRTAAVNQMAGTGRWRIAGDALLASSTLPEDTFIGSSDEEQNQGQYYLRVPHLGAIVTVRREPHSESDTKTGVLQMQLATVKGEAPPEFRGEVRIYISIPPPPREATFEVCVAQRQVVSHYIYELASQPAQEKRRPPSEITKPAGRRAQVRSTKKRPAEEEGGEAPPG